MAYQAPNYAVDVQELLSYWTDLDEENRTIVADAPLVWVPTATGQEPRLMLSDEQKQRFEENRDMMGKILETVSAVEGSNDKGRRNSNTQDS